MNALLTNLFALAPLPNVRADVRTNDVRTNDVRLNELDTELPIEAKQAAAMILAERAPRGLRVKGHLNLANNRKLTHLPEGLSAPSINLSGCTSLRALPDDLRVRRLNVSGCTSLRVLPRGFSVYELEARELLICELPSGLRVEYRLDLSGCTRLEALPRGLKVGSLLLSGCTNLRALPEKLDVCFLDVSGCTSLRAWPESASVRIGRLNASGCVNLRAFPAWLRELSQLDISGCANLGELPDGLRVSSWIDVADAGLTQLPVSMSGAKLRWRGVPISERIAFRPETITVREVTEQANAELRRVLLSRMGYEKFLQEADARTLDQDHDPGGERRLLQVALPNDEALVCLAVFCPSTGRQYMLRVPPSVRSCRQAAAWIAGFDSADDYRPIAET